MVSEGDIIQGSDGVEAELVSKNQDTVRLRTTVSIDRLADYHDTSTQRIKDQYSKGETYTNEAGSIMEVIETSNRLVQMEGELPRDLVENNSFTIL